MPNPTCANQNHFSQSLRNDNVVVPKSSSDFTFFEGPLIACQKPKESLIQKLQQLREQDILKRSSGTLVRKAEPEVAPQVTLEAPSENVAAPVAGVEINYQSPVNYAKSRFSNNAHNLALSNSKPSDPKPTQKLDNQAKNKWECPQPPSSSPSAPLSSAHTSPPKVQFLVFVSSSNLQPTVKVDTNEPVNSNDGTTQSPAQTQSPPMRLCATTMAPSDGRSPVRPFLSRGSVAERVMLFEKCPETRSQRPGHLNRNDCKSLKSPVLYSHWRNQDDNQNAVATKAQNYENGTVQNKRKVYRRQNTLRRGSWSAAGLDIPKFYNPNGRPYTSLEIENQLRKIRSEFDKFPGKQATRGNMVQISRACGIPVYWKEPLCLAVSSLSNTSSKVRHCDEPKNVITCDEFVEYWKRLLNTSYDEVTRFVRILTNGQRNYLVPDDFVTLVQDVVDTHPGLGFLRDAVEFHSRYVQTVIARIFYVVNKSWSGRISIPELRKSNFLSILSSLDDEEDINNVTHYFSYEHFYVIYCKFWELDKDHDLIIDKYDLARHNAGAMSSRMIDRIFSGAVTRGPVKKHGKMTYSEFVWFLMSEEDKRQPRSIEYWFRCMDTDGDGFLSMYELEYFYEEQARRMEAIGIESLPFVDCLCQMLDMVRPQVPGKVSLSDLKRCRMTAVFFDTFFNLDKYLDHEQRDPFASNKVDDDGQAMSDWDRYAADEYELLVAEEGSGQSTKQSEFTDDVKTIRSKEI
ncbi:Serine/threonine-protein phosphatase 2A regulatory subunit B'' subunit beta [Halotydeus destructor]|nr:Serine/threonine-protein phosphatase 2A regulatory subunit B'' subunit beta [Halotydeus destructor]